MTDDTIDLREYLVVLRRRWWTIAMATATTVLVALVISIAQTPVYASTSRIVIESFNQQGLTAVDDLLGRTSVIETERIRLLSQPVRERVDARLGVTDEADRPWTDIDVEVVPDTQALDITITALNPDNAAIVANVWASEYLDWRRQEAADDFLAAQADLDERAAAIREQIATLPDDPDDDTPQQAAERNSLNAQLAQVTSQRVALGDGQQVLRGGGSILEEAVAEPTPVSPRHARTGVLAAVLGIMLGVGLAFVRDYLDDEIREVGEVKQLAGNIPILGALPHWTDDEHQVLAITRPHSAESEGFRTLTTSIRFLLAAHGDDAEPGSTVLVTSADASEGKTSLAVNVAVAAARAGTRTILVDADLRRPNIHAMFGLPAGIGLTNVLVDGELQLGDGLVDVGISDLRILPSGPCPPNPSELLASPRMRQILTLLSEVADLVLIDSPPAGLVSDALQLAPHADSTIQVVRLNLSHRRKVADTIDQLALVGARPSGLVVNDLTGDNGRYHGYYNYSPQSTSTAASSGSSDRGRQARSGPRRKRRSRRAQAAAAEGLESNMPEARSGAIRLEENAVTRDRDIAPDDEDHLFVD